MHSPYLVSHTTVLILLTNTYLTMAEEPFVRVPAPHEDLVRWIGYSPDVPRR